MLCVTVCASCTSPLLMEWAWTRVVAITASLYLPTMVATRTIAVFLSLMVAVAYCAPQHVRAKRQLADDNTLQPIEDADTDEQTREKRKLEGITQAKFGVKNAVLGFVFGDGITSHRQARSTDGSPARVSLFPTSSITKQSSSITPQSSSITPQSHSITPNSRSITPDSRSITSNSRSITPNSSTKLNSLNSRGTDREARQADDIPVFDRNKVSLEFPGSMFGPTLSLLIRTTKIVGDVIQNSAVRYQTFLRLFRPLFRGQFEIKGLDPPTTTTTTTTTTTAAPVADNEVRRR